jgi:hypothetical protein
MTKQALIELRDKVAANAEKYVVVNQAIDALEGGFPRLEFSAILANFQKAYFDDSLDAAVAFLGAALPDWSWGVQRTYEGSFLASVGQFTAANMVKKRFETNADTPARALLLATLDVLIARAE